MIQRVLIATDAWRPQVNGVVRTYENLMTELQKRQIEVSLLEPSLFYTVPLPGYAEIRLSLVFSSQIKPHLDAKKPNHVHIATEGPIGYATRRYCVSQGIPFTTSFHTKFPEYIEARTRIPSSLSYYFMRQFHAPSAGVLVSTGSLKKSLESKGFQNLELWPKGVDLELFKPQVPLEKQTSLLGKDVQGPLMLYVGRVAIEKNIQAFLDLDVPGTKVIVGDGPLKVELTEKYPQAHFVGSKHGQELVDWYNLADVFVFPSQTDTYGNVILEALACGLPVAAYPVTGPIDILSNTEVGALDWDLKRAIEKALTLKPEACRQEAEKYSWSNVCESFLEVITQKNIFT